MTIKNSDMPLGKKDKSNSSNLKTTVIIVGIGFAGLKAARILSKVPHLDLILIDRKNHHTFQPLLYQVATAGLSPSDISYPIRAQFSNRPNTKVILGKVTAVNLNERQLTLDSRTLPFDFLILACGAQHSYFAHPEWEEFAPGLKTIEQATEIRRRILLAFENAENATTAADLNSNLIFAIVGGGPTGVELAGAIADISRTVLQKDFRNIDPSTARVILIEAGPKILPSFSPEISIQAKKDLEALGVEVLLSTRVEKINAEGVGLGSSTLVTQNIFWAAGVQATQLKLSPQVGLDKNGRIRVNRDFSIPDYPNVFVAGDMAAYSTSNLTSLPGVAPAAIQSGQYIAESILNTLSCCPRQKFKYRDKGQLATIGKNKAVAEIKFLKLKGHFAWITWLVVHVFFLIGFKNKISVVAQWIWSYLFSKRGARLITEHDWKLKP